MYRVAHTPPAVKGRPAAQENNPVCPCVFFLFSPTCKDEEPRDAEKKNLRETSAK